MACTYKDYVIYYGTSGNGSIVNIGNGSTTEGGEGDDSIGEQAVLEGGTGRDIDIYSN